MTRIAFILAGLALAAPASAQSDLETFELPAGCDAFVTIQSKDCTVEHHFYCEADPQGHKRRVAFDEEGITYLGTTDAETQWVESFHPRSQHVERLEPSPADRASLSELVETGIDTYDFRTLSDEIGPTRYVGFDRLTGRTVTIDDVTLEETEFQITAFDAEGNETWSAQGQEFIKRDWQSFIAGPGKVTVGGESFDEDDSPVEFIFPGEPGFLSVNPKHGCGATMSSFPVPS